MSPAAYTAKIAVSVAVVSPSRSRYTNSSGTGMFVPKATVNRTSDSAGHPPCRLRVIAGDDTAQKPPVRLSANPVRRLDASR